MSSIYIPQRYATVNGGTKGIALTRQFWRLSDPRIRRKEAVLRRGVSKNKRRHVVLGAGHPAPREISRRLDFSPKNKSRHGYCRAQPAARAVSGFVFRMASSAEPCLDFFRRIRPAAVSGFFAQGSVRIFRSTVLAVKCTCRVISWDFVSLWPGSGAMSGFLFSHGQLG